jgi:hypothetical protein
MTDKGLCLRCGIETRQQVLLNKFLCSSCQTPSVLQQKSRRYYKE